MVFCTLDILRADILLDFTLAKTSISTQSIALLSIASPLYNPHSKGVNSVQRFSPTRSFD